MTITNPDNTRPAFKRIREIVPGDFIVGFGYVATTKPVSIIGPYDMHQLTNADGKSMTDAGSIEQLVRVSTISTDTALTDSPDHRLTPPPYATETENPP